MKKMKTHPGILKKVYAALGRGTVLRHEPTETNRLGQSGLHTFVDDILDVLNEAGLEGVWDAETQHKAWKGLHKLIIGEDE